MEKNFDKEKFSKILSEIYTTYSNQRDFASAMGISRGYLSQYINKKLKNPPSPKILERIAEASKGSTTYEELMGICGYTDYMYFFFFDDAVHQDNLGRIPVISKISYVKEKNAFEFMTSGSDFINANFILDENKEYYSYRSQDDSMLPLLGKGDLAIIEKNNSFENGNTCLISLDNSTIIIRKILDFKDYIELHTIIPYNQPIKLTNDDKKSRNFIILGKVIRVENESAFQ